MAAEGDYSCKRGGRDLTVLLYVVRGYKQSTIFFTKHNRKIAHLKHDGHLQVKINDDDHLQVTIITIF